MAFTSITVTAELTRADGSPSQGTIVAQLTRAMSNDGAEITPAPIEGRLDDEGKLVNNAGAAFVLAATDDPDTEPANASYQWTLTIDQAPTRSFFAPLSHSAPEQTVDLSELES
jgi:hypothetical protein